MVTPLATALISADELLTGYFLSEDIIETSKKGVIFFLTKVLQLYPNTFFFLSVTQKNWIMVVKPEICFKAAFSFPKGFPFWLSW